MRGSLAPYALDPFGPSANPTAYVACEATERARVALERSLDAGRVGALVGPPGHGKTLLLRLVVAREAARARVVYVPFCSLEVDEFFTLALNLLGAPRPGPPRAALLELARELAPRGGILMLVDDANALSDACAKALASLVAEGEGTLRLGLAAIEGADATRVCAMFGNRIDVVHLTQGMTAREARHYVETRLAYAGARPELVAAFDDETIGTLHATAQGVPRRLNLAAQNIVRRTASEPMPRLSDFAWKGAPGVEPPSQPVTSLRPASPATSLVAPLRVTPPRVTSQRVTPPVASRRDPAPVWPDHDDGEGILVWPLPAPREGTGEYRVVRGRSMEPHPGQPAEALGKPVHLGTLRRAPGATGRPARVGATATPSPVQRRQAGVTDEGDAPWQIALSSVSLRWLGVMAFVTGVWAALLWMTATELPVRHVRPPVPEAVATTPTAQPGASAPAPAVPPSTAPAQPAARVLVAINATPWASVEVDGRDLGETPLASIELEVGPHTFRAHMPDGSVREQVIEIDLARNTVVFE